MDYNEIYHNMMKTVTQIAKDEGLAFESAKLEFLFRRAVIQSQDEADRVMDRKVADEYEPKKFPYPDHFDNS